MSAGSILILTGPPGSGKSTVARLVAESSEMSAHLEADVFFRWIVGGYMEPWLPESHEQNTFVMLLVGDVAASYAGAGYLTIVDGMLIPGWFFEPVLGRLEAESFDVATVILRPSLEVCLRRTGSRADRPLGEPAVIEQLWNSFADLDDPLEQLVIDNGDQSPDATAAHVIESLHREGTAKDEP